MTLETEALHNCRMWECSWIRIIIFTNGIINRGVRSVPGGSETKETNKETHNLLQQGANQSEAKVGPRLEKKIRKKVCTYHVINPLKETRSKQPIKDQGREQSTEAAS